MGDREIRAVLALVRLLVVLVPLAILGWWGVGYVASCLDTLQAPGVPIEVRYRAAGGDEVRVRANSYQFDWRRGTARLNRIRLTDSKNTTVASLDSVSAVGLNFLWGADQVADVRARNLQARLVRLRSGRFELQDLLPPSDNQPSTTPYHFELDRARVTFIDRAGVREWRQNILATGLRADGLGDDWVGSAGVLLPGIGSATGRVQKVANEGISIVARTSGLEAAGVYRHLLEIPERKALGDFVRARFSSLRVSGPFAVYLPERRDAVAETQLKADVRDFAFDQYRFTTARFEGIVGQNGARGRAWANDGDVRGSFTGAVRWTKGLSLAGATQVSAPSPQALPTWIRKSLPSTVSFEQANFAGWVSYEGNTANADGTLVAERLRVGQEVLVRPDSLVHIDPSRVLVRLRRGTYLGRNANGVLAYDVKSGGISGAVSSTYTSLAPIVARFPQLRGLVGDANLSVSIAGTAAKPIVNFEARGSGSYTPPGRPRIVFGRYDVAGTFRDGLAVVSRGVFQGPAGLVTVSGNVSPSGRLDLAVVGRGINIHNLDSRVYGRANARAFVTGTFAQPQAKGRVEVYNLVAGGQDVTALSGDFGLDRQKLTFTKLDAWRGAAHVQGTASLTLADQRITSILTAENVQLDSLTQDAITGSLDAPAIFVTGTLSSPSVSGSLRARDIIAQGVKIESIDATLQKRGDDVVVRDGVAVMAGGKVTATGTYSVAKKGGTFTAQAEGIDLNRLVPQVARYATIEGVIDGQATLQVVNNRIASAKGNGTLDRVVVNKTPVGAGPWDASYDGKRVTASADVGQLERFISLSGLNYDLQAQRYGGKVEMFKMRVQDLVGAALPSFPDLSADAVIRLRDVTGEVNLSTEISGSGETPQVKLTTLEVNDLSYREQALGTLTASGNAETGRYQIETFALNGPVGNIKISGTVEDHGSIDLNGELSRADISRLAVLDPRLEQIGGFVDVSFVANGLTANPSVRASIKGERLFATSDKTPDDQTLRVLLDTVEVTPQEGKLARLDVEGNYYYRGFQGQITGEAPLRYPLSIRNEAPLKVTATLARRDIREIAELVQGLDPKESEGFVSGRFEGSGTSNDFQVSGGLDLDAPKLALVGGDFVGKIDTQLRNLKLHLGIAQNRGEVSLRAESSRGGSLEGNVAVNLGGLQDIAQTVQKGAFRELLDNPLEGKVALSDFAVREEFQQNTYAGGVASGTITLGGTLQRPRISGELTASGVDTVLPVVETSPSAGGSVSIDPAFDLRFTLADVAHLRTATADFRLLGDGALQGSLTQPSLGADLVVEKGSIRLPGATVRIEQGGTIDLAYRVTAGEPLASLTVDLEGRTSVSALRFDQTPERYDITLELTGDLLKDNGLRLVASADPPDLSQDRILALLGQVDLISSIGTGGIGRNNQDQLRSALVGFALPVVFDPFTSRLADVLGLEYLNVDYNQFGQTNIAFSKALNREFFVTGSRQLSAPPPGFAQPYELRLVYRPRRAKGILRRLSFSIGTDQDRPWKLAIEYGARF